MSILDRFGSPSRARHVAIFSNGASHVPKLREVLQAAPAVASTLKRQRAHIWELSPTFHCSIVGTCLTTADVRHLLVKLESPGASSLSEHQVHSRGVQLASRSDVGGKLLNKTLDRKHRTFISRFSEAHTPNAVRALWAEALKAGDIPGAYWAAMTHPHATDDVLRGLFEDVHMLSHLVGAANRADIRRLCELEAENAALAAKVSRQQTQLRDALTTRDAEIREMQRALASALREQQRPEQLVSSTVAATAGVASPDTAAFRDRLGRLANRCERLESRIAQLTTTLADERRLRGDALSREAVLQEEIAALEAGLGTSGAGVDDAQLGGGTILYVGGRTHHIPRLRQVIEEMGGSFLHHDGGEEVSSRHIGHMIGRADIVVFPVDCVSHDAVGNIKRTCRQLGRRYVPLRSSGVGSLVAALRELSTEARECAGALAQ